jgi:hypothetical protein
MRGVVRVWFLCGGVLWFAGCGADEQYKPEIVYELRPYSAGPKPGGPGAAGPGRTFEPRIDYSGIPTSWVPPRELEKGWTAIIIHHSATETGSTAVFDRWHRIGRGWEGVGYDFVIGNGNGSGDGEVEVTYRWRRQMVGAHCKTDEDNWANREAIGVCLVGDFNETLPTPRQMQSMAKLVRFLQNRYNIAASRIYGHRSTPGARVTDCPGRLFPMGQLNFMLSRLD